MSMDLKGDEQLSGSSQLRREEQQQLHQDELSSYQKRIHELESMLQQRNSHEMPPWNPHKPTIHTVVAQSSSEQGLIPSRNIIDHGISAGTQAEQAAQAARRFPDSLKQNTSGSWDKPNSMQQFENQHTRGGPCNSQTCRSNLATCILCRPFTVCRQHHPQHNTGHDFISQKMKSQIEMKIAKEKVLEYQQKEMYDLEMRMIQRRHEQERYQMGMGSRMYKGRSGSWF